MYGEPGIVQEILLLLVPASVFGLAIGLGVFAGVYFAVTLAMKRWMKTYKAPVPRSALEVIRERYARGEISRKEYEQLRDDLDNGH